MPLDSEGQIVVLSLGECRMKPKPFIPEVYKDDKRFICDKSTGLIWHRCENRTLYADTDRSNVVYHSNYLRYFEFGRASLMRDVAYPYKEVEDSGFVYPIISLGIDFYKSLFYDDPMYVHTRPTDLERVKLKFGVFLFTYRRGEQISATYFFIGNKSLFYQNL